jgi:hypothetical protein
MVYQREHQCFWCLDILLYLVTELQSLSRLIISVFSVISMVVSILVGVFHRIFNWASLGQAGVFHVPADTDMAWSFIHVISLGTILIK